MADITSPANVIRYLQHKNADGSFGSPLYLGSELRFVTPTRNANLNNLEEQLIIGCDSISEEFVNDDGNTETITEFHNGTVTSNFYRIRTITYAMDNVSSNTVSIVTDESDGTTALGLSSSSGFTVSDGVLYGSNSAYSISEDGSLDFSAADFVLLEESFLSYVGEDNSEIDIAYKKTLRKLTSTGRATVKEIVYNYLKGDQNS